MPNRYQPIDGILLLDKPIGLSSNAALQRARRLYGAAKAGHGGSLDPLASGMLPVCFGQATKVCGPLLGSTKIYQVTAVLGSRTATGDAEGEVVETAPLPAAVVVTLAASSAAAASMGMSEKAALQLAALGAGNDLEKVLRSFLGIQEQIPPMYSALKQQGRRLYDLARQGQTVERAPRVIDITRLEWIDRHTLAQGELELVVECSKGTYIRTLVEDIAVRWGTVAYTKKLRRLSVAPFGGRRMYSLEELQAMDPGTLPALLLSPDEALAKLPAVHLDAAASVALLQGKVIYPAPADADRAGAPIDGGPVLRAYGPGGRFLGMVEALPDGSVRARRLFS